TPSLASTRNDFPVPLAPLAPPVPPTPPRFPPPLTPPTAMVHLARTSGVLGKLQPSAKSLLLGLGFLGRGQGARLDRIQQGLGELAAVAIRIEIEGGLELLLRLG